VIMNNKYHAKRTWSDLCDRTFDSRAEARRGEELALLKMGGEIQDLQYQPKFLLSEKPKVTYTADFKYIEEGKVIYEDVKGVLTESTRIKIAWLRQSQGIKVILIKM